MSLSQLPGAILIGQLHGKAREECFGNEAQVAHYASPYREERALREGKGVVELATLSAVRVQGPDALSWLHSLTSQHLENLLPGQSTELLLLDAQGHIEVPTAVIGEESGALLLVDSSLKARLVDFLSRMIFMKRVEISEPDYAYYGFAWPYSEITCAIRLRDWDEIANDPTSLSLTETVEIEKSEAEKAVLSLSEAFPQARIWQDPWPQVEEKSAFYAPEVNHPGYLVRRAIALFPYEEAEKAEEKILRLGLQPAGFQAWEALRISLWRPSARELDEKALPHEYDWLRTAVHLEKGCYRGQETVAKIVNLGRPPRRLTMLYLECSEDYAPSHGTPVYWGSKRAGSVLSFARSVEEGPIALAMLRRNVPEDAILTLETADGENRASQQIIVPAEGKSSASPNKRPGSELRAHIPFNSSSGKGE